MDFTENKSYKCDFCYETLDSQDLLDDHTFKCVEINPVICPVCYLVFGGQVQFDEHMLIVHNNNNKERTNDRSEEFYQICCENQDLNNVHLPEELPDVSDNNEEDKLESDDISSGMGLLQDDRTEPEDLTMDVDPELADEVETTDVMGDLIEQHKEDDYECKELADDSKEVEDTDNRGDSIEQHKEDDNECEELADDSNEVEDADNMGDSMEQHKEDDYEYKELPDDSTEVEDTDVMGTLIEQHKEDDYECKEFPDDSKEVEDTDAMGNLIEQHKENDYECKEFPDDSTEVEDTDAIGNLIERHKEDDYECKEFPDNSTEVEDTDAMGNLIEQHKEDDYECKEFPDNSTEVEDTDAMGNLIEQHKENDYECKELADDSNEVEDADNMGNLIEQHKEDDYEYKELANDSKETEGTDAMRNLIEQHKDDDDDELKSEESGLSNGMEDLSKDIEANTEDVEMEAEIEGGESPKPTEENNEMNTETDLSNGMPGVSDDIEANSEDMEIEVEPNVETQYFSCIKCMMKFPDEESCLKHKQLCHSHVKVVVERLPTHAVLVCGSSQQKNSDQESTRESEKSLEPPAINHENSGIDNLKPLFKRHSCVDEDGASETALRQHLSTKRTNLKALNSGNNNSTSFHCKMCGKAFVHKLVWIFHQSMCKREHPHPLFECVVCGQVFTQEKGLLAHQYLRDCSRRTYFCMTCKKTFISHLDLNQHICTPILKERKLHCTVCDKVFPSVRDLDQHTCSFDNNKQKYRCSICRMLFSSLNSLGTHVDWHRINDKKTYKCEKCSKLFQTEYLRRRHMTEHDRCPTCGKSFARKASLDFHILSHNDTKSTASYNCRKCKMVFGKQWDYTRHMRLHQIYCFCPVCKEGFNSEDSLSEHLLTHSVTSDRLTCQYCRKRFIAKEYLDKHMVSYHNHQNKKPDIQIEKTQNDENKLLDNLEKPFKCSQCHLSFAKLGNLSRHILAHVISYICPLCEATFQEGKAYLEHVQTHATTQYTCKLVHL